MPDMKLAELKEMAIRSGDLTAQADAFAAELETHLKTHPKNAKHVGDIDSFKVRRYGNFFSVWDGDQLVAALKIDPIPGAHTVVDDLWTKASYRGKKILSKLLWFLKSRENHKQLLLGKVHTPTTQEIISSGGFSQFKRYWFDPITGDTEEFEPATVDKFYSMGKQKWSLMLESRDDFFDMPRFNTLDAGYISQAYDWQIE
jgi:hypothetical protein